MMNVATASVPLSEPFTPKIPLVGRRAEVERLRQYLHDRGAMHVVYYVAPGGIGKTRILEELMKMVQEAGPGFRTSGIVDLYHTDTHSTSDVERVMMEQLDPEGKHFPHYREERRHFEQLRELGADPTVIEAHRAHLVEAFIADCRDLALDSKKLVLCFDTIELLQHESSLVEEMAGLEAVDTRVKVWLLRTLPRLNNVLIIFAGRPKPQLPGEQEDPQARLEADMRAAFGERLDIVRLEPFTLDETREFLDEVTDHRATELLPDELIPAIQAITGGRPILLHLIVDLLRTLLLEPRRLLDCLDSYAALASAAEDDPELQKARGEVERILVEAVFNEAKLGVYLTYIALMPKGVNEEILQVAFGLTSPEAKALLDQLRFLSFVKEFKPLPGIHPHVGRLFLHDEMYRLLRLPGVVPRLSTHERTIARTLTERYYDPQIKELETQIAKAPNETERTRLREQLQKLQVERLYYLLVWDPQAGYHGREVNGYKYKGYKGLSEEAMGRRWTGFGMRLLDEFLRFYNVSENDRFPNRERLAKTGISEQQVLKDSLLLWVQRFFGWARYKEAIQLAEHIFARSDELTLSEDMVSLGAVRAYWAFSKAILAGQYEDNVAQEVQKALDRLLSAAKITDRAMALTSARLHLTLGYVYRLGGRLAEAARAYSDSLLAYRTARGYQNERAMALNNLAYVYALQGRLIESETLCRDGLALREELGYEYDIGLSKSTMCEIAIRQQKLEEALSYGQEAQELFQRCEDAHGLVMAYTGLGQAARQLGRHEAIWRRRPEEALKRFDQAVNYFQSALKILQEHPELRGERLTRVYNGLGCTYYDRANLIREQGDKVSAHRFYQQAEQALQEGLKEVMPPWAAADALEDLAEVQWGLEEGEEAEATLQRAEVLIDAKYRIVQGQGLPASEETPSTELWLPMGKIELLRGTMAFDCGDFRKGMTHHLFAYAYFHRYSPDAVQLANQVRNVYMVLRKRHGGELQDLIEHAREVITQHKLQEETASFMKRFNDLLGLPI